MALIDWAAVTLEATALLREYVRIDTSNPPGNEMKAAEFLRGVLEADGIEAEVAEAVPGRGNLFARIGPAGPTVCLLNHSDVVPVERGYWSVDPFAGELHRGSVWGRGTLDMKGMAIIELMSLLLVKRMGLPLRRGLSFLALADEEAGSEFGATWVAEHRPSWMDAELVINEGAYGMANLPGGTQLFQVSPTEKVPLWLRLTVKGRPGHGSVPHDDNCAERLVRALAKLEAWKQPLEITPVMRDHVMALADAGLVRAANDKDIEAAAERSPGLRARLANTVVLTTISTGVKVNVIPSEASATLDCRLLPHVDVEAFMTALRATLADEQVGIEVLNRSTGAATSMDHEFIEVVDDIVGELVEGARLVPDMTSGFTDSRIFRQRGVASFGFIPCLIPPGELSGIHGHDERIGVDNLRLGIQIMTRVVQRLCGA
ncbi:MAG: M20/M25/M40 family metallo-hydrolase [Dehalococcoidia bacterium]